MTGHLGSGPPGWSLGATYYVELDLAPDPACVRLARSFVDRACVSAGIDGDARDTAVLLTSEVVTNAFVHGCSVARLSAVPGADRMRVEVGDDNLRLPRMAEQCAEALNGRGLAIVDILAADWGARQDEHGKSVWFEVAVR